MQKESMNGFLYLMQLMPVSNYDKIFKYISYK